MTPAVIEKYNEAKGYYEAGNTTLLPLLKAIQGNDSITGNSTEYKQLVKAVEDIQNGVSPKKKNKDGFVAGQEVSEKEYFKHIAQMRNKK